MIRTFASAFPRQQRVAAVGGRQAGGWLPHAGRRGGVLPLLGLYHGLPHDTLQVSRALNAAWGSPHHHPPPLLLPVLFLFLPIQFRAVVGCPLRVRTVLHQGTRD